MAVTALALLTNISATHFSEAKALQTEQEILVTRDSKPVAKLVRYVEPDKPRKRFDPVSHGMWQQKMSRGKITRWVYEGLLTEWDEL